MCLFIEQLDPLPSLLLCVALFTLHTHVWAVFRGATPPLAPLLLLLLLRLSHWICSLVLIQPAAAAVGPEYERCPESIDVQNPWKYPCAGEARTDHRGGLSLSSRQKKGKSHGESMAVEEEGLRVFQSVKIKIGEAKNIPPYPGPNRMRDCYCTVNLDQEEVFRTKIIEKSLCPFYGEDFYCEIPRSFRHLSFYIFDRDVFRRDSSIGKVAVKKEDLQKYHGKDTWFQLQPVSADSEVQGKVHLELRLSEVITDSGVINHKLATRVLECQGLPIVNGQCDPYAAVSLLGPSRSEAKKTKVTRPLSYTKRQFDVEEEDVDKLALRVDLWNASNLKFGDEFLGGVRVPLRVLGQAGVHDAWYFLQPRENGGKSVKVEELGSLRLNIVYTEDHVFPILYRQQLYTTRLLLSCSARVSVHGSHPGRGVSGETGSGHPPRASFLHYGKIVPFISAIAHAEVNRTQDPNTIFRGNSLTSKCIDETMKLAGMHYLQVTLKPIIDEICAEHKPCEIDPVKLKESENLETNRENLRHYVDRIFNVITTSGIRCPTVMCDIFFSLRESAATRFQVDQDVRYTAVSSFIFLRFFAPAILSPNLFHLRPHHPDPATSRTLTLISKTIQTLGSLAKSKSACPEAWPLVSASEWEKLLHTLPLVQK
ncbi:Ras GTPase-activating protein 3 GAP1(IP4BP) [Collichthys lucidus]|uniref:Ras GTPase-activating protein 3 GAP1(IP4BP) n=1 Tax=Collichthys lucidus TaxID=240159 RepID=A0A4U5U7N0_COLLU|nr:Ras GTPase-activating protein 3 GAP1(IP4BP) [Collichthys lucidus]